MSKKISDLAENTAPADDDLLPLVDVSDTPDATEKVTVAKLHETIRAGDGTTGNPSYTFASALTTGMSQSATLLSFSSGGTAKMQIGSAAVLIAANLQPNQDGTRDCGDPTLRWNSVHTETIQVKSHAAYAGSVSATETGAVRTTDANAASVWTKTLADNTLYWVEANVIGRDEGGTNRAAYKRFLRVHRQAAGGATAGTVAALATDESNSAWDCTIDVNSNDVRVRVTGANSVNISWVATVTWQAVSTSA